MLTSLGGPQRRAGRGGAARDLTLSSRCPQVRFLDNFEDTAVLQGEGLHELFEVDVGVAIADEGDRIDCYGLIFIQFTDALQQFVWVPRGAPGKRGG